MSVACLLRRLRPDNPYLLLDEFGESSGNDNGLTTELGVMGSEGGGPHPGLDSFPYIV
jgi:hypothetical protein